MGSSDHACPSQFCSTDSLHPAWALLPLETRIDGASYRIRCLNCTGLLHHSIVTVLLRPQTPRLALFLGISAICRLHHCLRYNPFDGDLDPLASYLLDVSSTQGRDCHHL